MLEAPRIDNFAWASAPIYHLAWQGTFTGCIRRWIDGVHAIHLRTSWALSLSLGQRVVNPRCGSLLNCASVWATDGLSPDMLDVGTDRTLDALETG